MFTKDAKDDKGKCTLNWADAQEQFSLGEGAMNQGSESPVNFLDLKTCDDILKDLRRDFESDLGSPLPALEVKVACDRGTLTTPVLTQDQSTYTLMARAQDYISTVSHQGVQALPPQLVAEGSTQTLPA